MNAYIREPINSLTHLFGAIMAAIGLIMMIVKVVTTGGSALTMTAVIVFGLSMILLYSASAIYHMVLAKPHVIAVMRRIDHAMIFVLIAGTYTPLCLISLAGPLGWTLFGIVQGLALLGIIYKLVWFNAPRWLSTGLYIAMGWIVVFFSPRLAPIIGTGGMVTLVVGGLLYTIGGIIYWLKPNIFSFKYMGFHEIFHIFILLGSLFHFICVYHYVL